MATTVPCAGREMLVPVMPASVTDDGKIVWLVMGSVSGGSGGFVGNVMVTVTVVPRVAVPPGAVVVQLAEAGKPQ